MTYEAVDTATGEVITLEALPEAHEAAGVWPELTEDEYAELLASIIKNGLRDEIELDAEERKIVNGRNRLRACVEAGVTPRFRIIQGNPWTLAKTSNERRNLVEVVKYLCMRQAAAGEAAWDLAHREAAAAAAQALAEQPREADGTFGNRAAISDGTTDTERQVNRTSARIAELFGVGRAAVEKGERIRRFDGGRFEEPVRLKHIKPTEALRRIKKAEVAEKVRALPDGQYRVIYADPPWQYNDAHQVGAQWKIDTLSNYSTMPTSEICAIPVKDLAAPDAVLLCWSTFPHLPDALEVLKAWGFAYKTAFVWDKETGHFGHYHNVCAELLLIGVRGSCTPDIDEKVNQIQRFRREGHSRKPEAWRTLIDELWVHGPRVELFRRGEAPEGWQIWGAEAEDA